MQRLSPRPKLHQTAGTVSESEKILGSFSPTVDFFLFIYFFFIIGFILTDGSDTR